MKPVVYVDVLFLVNFLVNFSLLYLTGKILRLKIKYLRVFGAAGAGALYAVLMFLPEKIYTNGVSDITHFDMWREIARVEPIGENAYKIVQRSGVKYKLYLHEGDRLPVNLTTPDDIGTEAFKH